MFIDLLMSKQITFTESIFILGKYCLSKIKKFYFQTCRDHECDSNNFDINKSDPQWHNYFLCGVKGILEHSKSVNGGMSCMVSGCVPPSAGLSSSSALVCCAALSTMYAMGLSLTKVSTFNHTIKVGVSFTTHVYIYANCFLNIINVVRVCVLSISSSFQS